MTFADLRFQDIRRHFRRFATGSVPPNEVLCFCAMLPRLYKQDFVDTCH